MGLPSCYNPSPHKSINDQYFLALCFYIWSIQTCLYLLLMKSSWVDSHHVLNYPNIPMIWKHQHFRSLGMIKQSYFLPLGTFCPIYIFTTPLLSTFCPILIFTSLLFGTFCPISVFISPPFGTFWPILVFTSSLFGKFCPISVFASQFLGHFSQF